jgi:hypothetical protein
MRDLDRLPAPPPPQGHDDSRRTAPEARPGNCILFFRQLALNVDGEPIPYYVII